MRTHRLKIYPSAFRALLHGLKPWEYRKNDRDYMVGDYLRLEEWDPGAKSGMMGGYTKATYTVEVTHIVYGPQFDIPAGYCILTIDKDIDQGDQADGGHA